MASQRRYTVGLETFPTKHALVKRIQEILYSYRPGEKLKADDFAFICDLIDNHPRAAEKVGTGIESIGVRHGYGSNRKTQYFEIHRVNGTMTDFSFMKCIYPTESIQEIKAAFRTAIMEDIQAFRDSYFSQRADSSGRVQCSISGEWITADESHVDHTPPNTFHRLFHDFIEQNRIDAATIGVTGKSDNQLMKWLVATNFVTNGVIFTIGMPLCGY